MLSDVEFPRPTDLRNPGPPSWPSPTDQHIGPAVRVFLLHDNPIYRAGLRAALDRGATRVAGEAPTARSVRSLPDPQPRADVVVAGLGQSVCDAITATRALTCPEPPAPAPTAESAARRTPLLMIYGPLDDDTLVAALRAGVRSFVSRQAGPEELSRAVQIVAGGGTVLGTEAADRIERRIVDAVEHPTRLAFPELTEREREVLDSLASGDSTHRAARRLGLSEKTVRNYVSRTLTKLAVTNRAEAIHLARDAGLGRGPAA